MAIVTVSPKYQVVIPQEVRKSMKIRPGEKLEVFQFDNRIELVRVKTIKQSRGMLKGIDTNIDRDDGDRISELRGILKGMDTTLEDRE